MKNGFIFITFKSGLVDLHLDKSKSEEWLGYILRRKVVSRLSAGTADVLIAVPYYVSNNIPIAFFLIANIPKARFSNCDVKICFLIM